MKKIISYLGIYLFLHGMYLIQGCCEKSVCISINEIEARYTNSIGDTLDTGDTISYNAAIVTAVPITYEAYCAINPWISSANATTCSPKYYPMTKLEKINISAAQDYSTAYPTGSSLNDVFNIIVLDDSFHALEFSNSRKITFNTPPDNDMVLSLTIQFFYEHFERPFEVALPEIYLKK